MKNKKVIYILFLIVMFATHATFASMTKARQYNSSSNSNKYELIVHELVKSKFYFSALKFAHQHLLTHNTVSQKLEKDLETLVIKTSVESFINLRFKTLKKFKSHIISFVLGVKYFRAAKYLSAIKYLKSIPEDHRFAPETKIILGASYNFRGDFVNSLMQYNLCISSAKNSEDDRDNVKKKRYFVIIRENCIIHKTRILYKQAKYEEARDSYEQIPKTSYRWPYILLEKAWVNYHIEDYNRTLGLLVTYRYPLLSNYFLPESEVLTALAYLKLCLWNDALKIVEKYYTIYNPRSNELKGFLNKNRRSNSFFIDLVINGENYNKNLHPYIKNIIIQITKTIKFNIEYTTYRRSEYEFERLTLKDTKTDFSKSLAKYVEKAHKKQKVLLNNLIKKRIFDLISNIHRNAYEMFNIKLEILSKKRNLLYKNKKLISNRSRGSFENVKRRTDQHFWEFTGAFWADELGDYSFGLKSNCKVIKEGENHE